MKTPNDFCPAELQVPENWRDSVIQEECLSGLKE